MVLRKVFARGVVEWICFNAVLLCLSFVLGHWENWRLTVFFLPGAVRFAAVRPRRLPKVLSGQGPAAFLISSRLLARKPLQYSW